MSYLTYVWINHQKYTLTELDCMSLERLGEFRQIKQKDLMSIQNEMDKFRTENPFSENSPEYWEVYNGYKKKIRLINFGLSEINRIIKNKNRDNAEKENKLCYRFYTNAKKMLSSELFTQIEIAAKEEMILKGD